MTRQPVVRQIVRTVFAVSTIGILLGACASAPMRMAGPSSDERAFASTFASCRDDVRAGKTANFRISTLSPKATGMAPGQTGLALKAPYDKSGLRAKPARTQRDRAFRASVDRCLGDNGYDVVPFASTRN